jgi:hypothetical protein
LEKSQGWRSRSIVLVQRKRQSALCANVIDKLEHVAESTVFMWIASGKLEAVKTPIGWTGKRHQIRIDRADYDWFVSQWKPIALTRKQNTAARL